MALYGSERHGLPHQAMVFAQKELAPDLDVREVANLGLSWGCACGGVLNR